MSKIDEVRKAMVTAMKAGDKERKESLSMLLSALKNKAIDILYFVFWTKVSGIRTRNVINF